MTAQPDFSPLCDRVEGVLSRGEGNGRIIPAEHRFGLGPFVLNELKAISIEAHMRKRAFFWITAIDPQDPGEAADKKNYVIRAQVMFYYYVESLDRHEHLRAIANLAANDALRVRAALMYWENLRVDKNNVETGLNGGSFMRAVWAIGELDDEAHILTAQMDLEGSATFYNPAV